MAKKKLQIFVSSTYLDLIDEREAAVEAILSSKHIPAGMELFRAGNTSQWETIKRWINESDIYMLILGGRYGSIEPKSGKSYTQLEYEYAIEQGIPLFAVILEESFLHKKAAEKSYEAFEKDNKDGYEKFKKLVEAKLVKYVEDCKDIKLAIKDSISELEEECELIGWIRSNEGETGQLLQQLNEARLECDNLRSELQEYKVRIESNQLASTLSSGEEKTKIRYSNSFGSELAYVEITWNEIFIIFGKIIYKDGYITQNEIKRDLENEISKKTNNNLVELSEEDLIRIQIQLEKLNLVKQTMKNSGVCYGFTDQGKNEFFNQLLEKKLF